MDKQNPETNNLIKDVLQKTMVTNEDNIKHLNSLNENNEQIIKEITFRLIPFTKKNCSEEYKKISKNYQFVNDTNMGYQLILKGEEDLNSVYALERCIDRHTGINKKIFQNESEMNNIIKKNKMCNRECIENYKIDNSEKGMSICFNNCFEDYYKNHLYLLQNYFIDLSEVKSKLDKFI